MADQKFNSNQMDENQPFDPFDYTLAIKNKGRAPRPWRWKINARAKPRPCNSLTSLK